MLKLTKFMPPPQVFPGQPSCGNRGKGIGEMSPLGLETELGLNLGSRDPKAGSLPLAWPPWSLACLCGHRNC
jgi:hypothetical protein